MCMCACVCACGCTMRIQKMCFREPNYRVRLSLMAQPVCVWRTQQALIVLYLQLAINTYMDLFTVNLKLKAGSETPTHSSLSGLLN